MATVTVEPTRVRPIGQGIDRTGIAGEATTLGKLVQVVGDGEWENVNSGTAAGAAGVIGIVTAGGKVDRDGDIALGETISVRVLGGVYLGKDVNLDETKLYWAFTTDGLISDVVTSNFRAVGYPMTSEILYVDPVMTPPGS